MVLVGQTWKSNVDTNTQMQLSPLSMMQRTHLGDKMNVIKFYQFSYDCFKDCYRINLKRETVVEDTCNPNSQPEVRER